MINIKNKLRQILNFNKICHKKKIITQKNIKYAHIYCKINKLSGQVSGPLIEHYIKKRYNMTKNKPSKCIGDVKYNKKNIEIKVSTGGSKNNKFNYVQLRMNHVCEYILTAYYIDEKNLKNLGELFLFKLNKRNLINIISKYGNYAHGTIHKLGSITKSDLENKQNNKEYSLRPTYNDNCWHELLKFRIDEKNM